ncbi:hypothetical protein Tco_0903734 [Tanacetum coccineum]
MDKPITHEIIVLVKDLLMPIAEKTRANASEFENFLKEEMFDDLHFMTDIDEYSEMACKYLEKVKECECLEIELSKKKDTFLNDVNARSKKPQVIPIRPRKPIRKVNQSVATPLMKIVASYSTIQKSRSYYRMLYEKTIRDGENLHKMKEKGDPCIFVGYSTTSKGYRVYTKRTILIVESIHLNFDEIKEMTPLFEKYFTAWNQSVSKPFVLFGNSTQQDTQPTVNVQPTTSLITPKTTVNTEENNTDQAADAQFQPYEFIKPFCTMVQEVSESSSDNVDTSMMTSNNVYFIASFIPYDDDGLMTQKYFLAYTQTEVQQFCDTLIQHMESVKKSIDERALNKREYDIRVNERQMQTKEGKVDTRKSLDVSLVVTKSRQQHTEKPEFNNEGEVDQNTKQCHDKCHLLAKLTDNKIMELSNQSFESENIWQHGQFLKATSNEAKVKKDIDDFETINIELEHSVAKLLTENEHLNKENEHLKKTYKDLYDSIKKKRVQTKDQNDSLIEQLNKKSIENVDLKAQIQEKVFANATLKNKLRKLKGTSVDTKFPKPSILGKPIQHPLRNQSVVRQPTVFKSERPKSLKLRFASQVDVKNDLNSSKNMPRFSSNDMVHNHYLEEAKKKTQERGRNSRPSAMPSAKFIRTTNGSKPKPRINNHKSRNWHASKTSCVTTKIAPISEHSTNSRSFSNFKHFVCSTCQKCVFNANHDVCVTKFLNKVNSCAKVPSHKTTNRIKPVEKISIAKKPERQIPTRHRFSIKKTTTVHEKTMTPRSGLTWKPKGRIFTYVGLRCSNEMERGLSQMPVIMGMSHVLRDDSRSFSSKALPRRVRVFTWQIPILRILVFLFTMSAKDSIAIQTCELSEEEFNEFLALYPIPPEYHVILPKSNQTIFDAPPGYVELYTHSFSLANLKLPLTEFFYKVLEYF